MIVSLLRDWLKLAFEDTDEQGAAAEAVAALAVAPREPVRSQVLAVARKLARGIDYKPARVDSLVVLVPHLSRADADAGPQRRTEVVQDIQEKHARVHALAALARQSQQFADDKPLRHTLSLLWCGELRARSAEGRPSLLHGLQELVPVIVALAGQAGAEKTALAILDVGRCWP